MKHLQPRKKFWSLGLNDIYDVGKEPSEKPSREDFRLLSNTFFALEEVDHIQTSEIHCLSVSKVLVSPHK